MRVALLGTGTMGVGMTHSLLRAGHDVTVWNRTRAKAEPLASDGATVADDPETAVDQAEVVLTMLFDEDATRTEAERFLPAMADGAVWMQSATVGPAGAKRLGSQASDAGVAFVDSPVLGSKKPAEDGALTVLLAGPATALTTVRPVADAIGAKVVVAGGEVGDASALKLVGNAWTATLAAGTAQSVAMARALGLDPRLFLEAVDGGGNNAPALQAKGAMMVGGDFAPEFAVSGVDKDLHLMLDAVDGTDFSVRLLRPLTDAYDEAASQGYGGEDLAAVYRVFTD